MIRFRRTLSNGVMFLPLDGWRHVKVTDRHRIGLCSRLEGFSRNPLLQRQENRSGARQLSAGRGRPARSAQHPPQGFALSLPRRSKTARRAVRMAFHAKARHGSIWRSPNSASLGPSASIAASRTNKPSSLRSQLGGTIEPLVSGNPVSFLLALVSYVSVQRDIESYESFVNQGTGDGDGGGGGVGSARPPALRQPRPDTSRARSFSTIPVRRPCLAARGATRSSFALIPAEAIGGTAPRRRFALAKDQGANTDSTKALHPPGTKAISALRGGAQADAIRKVPPNS